MCTVPVPSSRPCCQILCVAGRALHVHESSNLKNPLTNLLLLLVVFVDEQFNYSKQAGFKGDGLAAIATAFTQTAAVSTWGIRV